MNVWAVISVFGKTSLEIFEGNLGSGVYIQILENHDNELARVDWRLYWFQQDKHSTHLEKGVLQWFKSKNITILEWSHNSPDLNPIENLWGWLKEEVKKQNPQSLDELRRCLRRNWELITVDFLQNFIKALPERFRLCIESGGDRFLC